ncbi:MAG: CBS domain-containing protein [Desulforhopalus sp.]
MSRNSKNTLGGIVVGRAMRRQVNCLTQKTTISNTINTLIKYKVNGILVIGDDGCPVGVVSKTDIVGAYYAELALGSPLEYIMSCPPLFCSPDDPLEKALALMRDSGVYRLYVIASDGSLVGALAYPDIVGILYQYCGKCEFSRSRGHRGHAKEPSARLLVGESMSRGVRSVGEGESLLHVMEELSLYRLGAILIKDREQRPAGVISKTDLILAYKHQVDVRQHAYSIMSTPVQSCLDDDYLEDAIRTMIFSDIHRLFVKNGQSEEMVGVFSLTDAARSRSGSCHACISSRIAISTG